MAKLVILGQIVEIRKVRVCFSLIDLTLSWRSPISYRNQIGKIDWFLYDIGLRHVEYRPPSWKG